MKTGSKSKAGAPSAGGGIMAFFGKVKNGVPPASPQPSTRCPMCDAPATQAQINNHLDDGCPPPPPKTVGQEPKTNPEGLSRPEPEPEVIVKDIKADDDDEDDAFSGSDTDFSALDVTSSQPFEDSSPSKAKARKVKASRSISNRPKKFGGVDAICSSSQGEVEFRPSSQSPRKRGLTPFKRTPTPKKGTPTPKKASENGAAVAANGTGGAKKALNFENGGGGNHVPLTEEKRRDPTHVPYYLRNFEGVLRGVLEETDDRRLFLESELHLVDSFKRLDLDARKLYVRLFQRKFDWLQSIKYDEIFEMEEALTDLCLHGFILDGSSLDDFDKVLELVSAPNLKKLCKEFNLKPKGSQKVDFARELVNHSKRKTFSFAAHTQNQNQSNPIRSKILSKARACLGDCYKLAEGPRGVFLRVLSLHSLSDWWEERESQQTGPPQQLTTIFLKNTGQVIYPSYDIVRERHIFRDRDDLLHFEEVCGIESRISEAFEAKDYEVALAVADAEALPRFQEEIGGGGGEHGDQHAESLPAFLRKFTAGSVLAYVLTKTVDVCEKLRNYEKAVRILNLLLGQQTYLCDYRGLWYERLALDLDQHLKQPLEALKAVERGLADPHVRVARKLALCQRVKKVLGTKRNSKLKEEHEERLMALDGWIEPCEPRQEVISGKLMPKENMSGAKSVFMVRDSYGDDILCSVEELVREHYRQLDFPQGLHAEGSVVNTLCTVLFWDVLYDANVPDAFRSPYQAVPLDFNTDDFYSSRRAQIDARLEDIKVNWSCEKLREFAASRWNESHHVSSCPANWDLFRDVHHFLGLLSCFTAHQLHGICQRLITNHRHTRSGFPDLTVWNPETREVRFIEVKGPGDRLSNKQILWLEVLTKLGIEAYVCHVEATNCKRLSHVDQTRSGSQSPSPKKKKVKSPTKSPSPKKKKVTSPTKSPSPKKKTDEYPATKRPNRTKKSDNRRRKDSGDDFA